MWKKCMIKIEAKQLIYWKYGYWALYEVTMWDEKKLEVRCTISAKEQKKLFGKLVL